MTTNTLPANTRPANNHPAVADALNGLLADSFALYLKTRITTGTSRGRAFVSCTCCSTSRRRRFSPRPT